MKCASDLFTDVCFITANLEEKGLQPTLEANVGFRAPLFYMAAIAIGCSLIILM